MSDTTREPCVVIIDDQLDNVQNLASDLRKGNLEVETTEPHQLGEVALREGTIFLVDMFLTEWPGRNKLRPSAQVFDGIALAAVIRAHARHADRPIPIVALNTGRADDLSELPLEIREHAIARAHNLEWVFLKNDSPSPVPTHERIAELADAQRRLPVTWTADTGFERAATPNGVIVLSADYTPRQEPVDITKAVRIRLDDWPPYAESAWAAISDALEDPRLRDRVLPLDRPRLEE